MASVGVGSSSRIATVTAGASRAPPPVARPVTVAASSASSRASSAAATVTSPLLAVAPGANTRLLDALTTRSAGRAGGCAVTVTRTVTAVAAAGLSRAVTVATPPASESDARDSASAACGAPSSSTMASSAAAGSATPWPPAACPDTVTAASSLPSGSSRLLSLAVIVTTPALAVAPAAMVRVVPAWLKSPTTAPVPAAAAIVTVTAWPEGWESPAVTVATPPFSAMAAGARARARVGRESSSARVSRAPATWPAATWLATDAVTVTDRPAPPSWASLSTATTVAVSEALAVAPAAMTMVASEPTP